MASAASTAIFEVTGNRPKEVSILDTACLMRLSLNAFGTTRKVNSDKVDIRKDETETTAAEDASVRQRIRVNKRILDCAEVEDLTKLDNDIRGYVYAQCLKSGMIDGTHWVPLTSLKRVNDRLEQYARDRAALVENLCDGYAEIQAADRAALGPLYIESDYPSVDKIRDAYRMTYEYMALSAPRSLQSVSEEMYMSAKEKMEENVREATDAVRTLLRDEFRRLVEHMANALSVNEDGKKKIFKSTLIPNFEAFLQTFSDRNITQDAELDALVQTARNLVSGVSDRGLRTDDQLRGNVRETMEEIRKSLDSMLEDEPVRMLMV